MKILKIILSIIILSGCTSSKEEKVQNPIYLSEKVKIILQVECTKLNDSIWRIQNSKQIRKQKN